MAWRKGKKLLLRFEFQKFNLIKEIILDVSNKKKEKEEIQNGERDVFLPLEIIT